MEEMTASEWLRLVEVLQEYFNLSDEEMKKLEVVLRNKVLH